jgi:hypothetical protein
MKNLKELEICLSFEEIKILSKQKFSEILNDKIKNAALPYLTRKQNVKGGIISYCHTRPILKSQPSGRSENSQLARWATKWYVY